MLGMSKDDVEIVAAFRLKIPERLLVKAARWLWPFVVGLLLNA